MGKIVGRVEQALDNEEERNSSYLFAEHEEITRYRVTGIQQAEQCGKLWRNDYINTSKGVANKYAQTGTLIHLIIEDQMRAFAGQDRILTEDDMQSVRERIDELGENRTMSNLWGKYLRRLMSYVIGNEIVDIEGEYSIPNGHIVLEGHADLILRDSQTGRITIIDHKTNRRPSANHLWEAKLQVQAYGNAVCEKFGVESVRFIIGNVNLDEDNIFTVYKSLSMMNARIGRAMRNIKEWENEHYRRAGDHCKYCGDETTCATRKTYKNRPTMGGDC